MPSAAGPTGPTGSAWAVVAGSTGPAWSVVAGSTRSTGSAWAVVARSTGSAWAVVAGSTRSTGAVVARCHRVHRDHQVHRALRGRGHRGAHRVRPGHGHRRPLGAHPDRCHQVHQVHRDHQVRRARLGHGPWAHHRNRPEHPLARYGFRSESVPARRLPYRRPCLRPQRQGRRLRHPPRPVALVSSSPHLSCREFLKLSTPIPLRLDSFSMSELSLGIADLLRGRSPHPAASRKPQDRPLSLILCVAVA